MEFSTSGRDDCYYRILVGTDVKYITIQAGALDAESLMDMPLSFQDILPSLPYHRDGWNLAYISRNAAGELEPVLSEAEFPRVETIWHPETVNFVDLERTKQLSLLAQECVWKRGKSEDDESRDQAQRTMIAKMARFPWEIQYIEAETRIYRMLEQTGIAPTFLGHIHESGRVIGFLLDKVQGRAAGCADLNVCEAALRRLHGLGIRHGDCNRYNFIIGSDGKVSLIDFDNARLGADAAMLEAEIAGLQEQLREETGRGGGFITEPAD